MAKDDDLPEFDDLMGVDLSQIELDDIELEADASLGDVWRWIGVFVLLGLGGVVLWIPTTELYQTSSHSTWLFATVCVVATVLGVLLGRWLWRWAEESARRWLARRPQRAAEPPKPPSTARRLVTLGLAIAGAGVILFAITPADLSGGQSGLSWIWYFAAVGAIVVGFFLGRWLLMQEFNPFKGKPKPVEIKLPPWVKWVTLSVMVVGGLVILVGMELFATDNRETLEFSLGGAAFLIGIVAAIWVARRFDETERKIRLKVQQERAVKVAEETSRRA